MDFLVNLKDLQERISAVRPVADIKEKSPKYT
jgi:hypothetical protein